MRTGIFLISVIFVLIQQFSYGQEEKLIEETFTQKYKWSVGVGAGFTTGYGFSVKYQPKKNGIQLNFLPYSYTVDNEQLVCVGLTLVHDFVNVQYNNVFLYFANSFTYYNNTNPRGVFSNYYNRNDFNGSIYNTGLGIGLQTNTEKRVVINIMLGYAQYDLGKRLFFTGETALHYRFN